VLILSNGYAALLLLGSNFGCVDPSILSFEEASHGDLPMLFAWIGFLKPDAEPIPLSVQQQTTDFLSQPYIDIQFVGPLRDENGKRAGMMMIFDVADRAAAEAFVKSSPYLDAGLYEDHRLYEYQSEVG
jgi:hypothetical protein